MHDIHSVLRSQLCVKWELQNRFNLLSEERVKFCEQNSKNLMKIGWKIRKLWHFEVSQIFTKHFLTSRYEYANERVDDVIASLLAIYFVHKILKNSIFCAYSYQAVLELTLFYIYSERNWGKSNILIAEIWKKKIISVHKMNGKLWGDDIINSLIYIFIPTGLFETSKCHKFLIFQPIFIRFSLFYSQIFTLSYEIKAQI